jgi:hypothetical protein
MPDAARPICPKCHLPIREGEAKVFYEGKSYHRHCAPPAGSAGDPDDPYSDSTPISI